MQTKEYVPGVGLVDVDANFRGYSGPQSSSADWWRLMQKPIYAQVVKSQDLPQAIQAIGASPYATDPEYAAKLSGMEPHTQAQRDFLAQRQQELIANGAPPHLAELGARMSALETGWGKHLSGGNNFYGIKGPGGDMYPYPEELPDITIQGPWGQGQEPPLGPQAAQPGAFDPAALGMPPQMPQMPQAPAQGLQPQAEPGFMDRLMGNPFFHMGLGILSAPGYGGNWLRGAATGAQQGLMSYQNQQKFQAEMDAFNRKKQQQDEIRAQARNLPEPFRSMVLADPASYGEVLMKMAELRHKAAGPQGKDRYIESKGRIFDTTTQQWLDLGEGQGQDINGLGGPLEPKDKVQAAGALRDDFRNDTKAYNEATNFYYRGRAASEGGAEAMTGADDMALVFSYMKLLDPTSVVRESEYATASNAAGVPEHLRGLWNKVLGGGTLSIDARKQLLDEMERQYTVTTQNMEHTRQYYAQIAKDYGIPAHWIFKESPDLTYGARTTTGQSPAARPQAPVSPTEQALEKEAEDLLR